MKKVLSIVLLGLFWVGLIQPIAAQFPPPASSPRNDPRFWPPPNMPLAFRSNPWQAYYDPLPPSTLPGNIPMYSRRRPPPYRDAPGYYYFPNVWGQGPGYVPLNLGYRQNWLPANVQPPPGVGPTPPLLPPHIVKVWTDAGAFVHPDDLSVLAFTPKSWKEGVLAKLPDPGVAFGLLLEEVKITDAGLKGLARLKSLNGLSLGDTPVTDAGLKDLAGLKKLQTLVLDHTKITDAGLKELARLTSLKTLNLRNTKVTDTKHLARLKNLQELDLGDTPVTDAGLTGLAGLKQLQSLQLGGTKVTGAGMKELAGLKSLDYLSIQSTQVTDAGLKALAGLKNLHQLNLLYTKVTDAGVARLQKELPSCKIIY